MENKLTWADQMELIGGLDEEVTRLTKANEALSEENRVMAEFKEANAILNNKVKAIEALLEFPKNRQPAYAHIILDTIETILQFGSTEALKQEGE